MHLLLGDYPWTHFVILSITMFGLNAKGQTTFDTTVAEMVVATGSVFLRFYCKYTQKNGFHLDDLFILLAIFCSYTAQALLIWGSITGGGGKEMEEILTSGDKNVLKQVSNYLEVPIHEFFHRWKSKPC